MTYCPKCGKLNTDDAVYCSSCGASLSTTSQPTASTPFQSEATMSNQPQMSSSFGAGELQQRLEKALRRTELLSYAIIGLSVLIFILFLIVIFGA